MARDGASDVMLRRAEVRLARGDVTGAAAWVARMSEASPTDGRGALLRGRVAAAEGDARAFAPLMRAMVLDVPGASELLSSSLAHIVTDEPTRERIRTVVAAKGEAEAARWRAAFARAGGQGEEARRALMDAVVAGDAAASAPLLDAAVEDRDYAALSLALARLPEASRRAPLARDAAKLPPPDDLDDAALAGAHFDALARVSDERVLPWADALRGRVARALVPPTGRTTWSPLLVRLDRIARELHDLDASAALASLSAERVRPVRIAIVGEFNAGKSTFINALIGADVAPTGVLPTTATLHHLRYAADPIARVHLRERPTGEAASTPRAVAGAERIVPLSELRATLASSAPGDVRRVEILLPLASLTRVEIIDTPGFNAPDASHAEAARTAFDEADAVLWLLDGTQAMKRTERVILEQVRAAHLPIQVLVNKADRLRPDDLAQVMNLVRESLVEVGITSWAPPLAFSAKLALKGKLGDVDALAQSGWRAIDGLLEAELVGKSDVLKERALRRRAGKIVATLGAVAADVARSERETAQALTVATRDMSQAAARLDRDADAASQSLASALVPVGAAWQKEIDVVVTGRDTKTTASDPAFARYRAERAIALIAPQLAAAMAKLAASASVSADALAPVAQAAAGALVDHLGAAALTASPVGAGLGRVRELMALAEALHAE